MLGRPFRCFGTTQTHGLAWLLQGLGKAIWNLLHKNRGSIWTRWLVHCPYSQTLVVGLKESPIDDGSIYNKDNVPDLHALCHGRTLMDRSIACKSGFWPLRPRVAACRVARRARHIDWGWRTSWILGRVWDEGNPCTIVKLVVFSSRQNENVLFFKYGYAWATISMFRDHANTWSGLIDTRLRQGDLEFVAQESR